MILTFIGSNIVAPLIGKGKLGIRPLSIIGYYCVVFFMFRPLIKYIISLTPEGRPVQQTHFSLIVVAILVMSFVGELVDERFSPFIFAFTLPEEPLGSILNEKLDPINNATNIPGLSPGSYVVEIILVAGYVGKFFGTFITSLISRFNFSHSIALALIMSSKGLMDIALIGVWRERLVSLLSSRRTSTSLDD
ncbi:hypothetical protein Cgig2_022992 [Carnegiea gigantea]|uniref:Cation/H+ exchanger domain-containing protein n=1 Tax=Carnegiea gigantea TaxID=171969 RepID=A0A9Q1JPY0_9CARY|nr:hypothetical protein Cgig2_022992 [Carnegiea gigantea]